MVQIIPAILATSEEDFKRDILRLMQSSSLKEGWLHIDFADNAFVPNQTITPSVVAQYTTDLYKEAHIMVAHPIEWIDNLAEAGFERIIFHLETQDETADTIELIKSKGLEVGIAVKNETLLKQLEPYVAKIDVVLLMSIVPGLQGQPFLPEVMDKIKETSRLRSKGNYSFRIGVDGGVRDTNIKELVDAGVDFVTVGSYLLKGDLDENLENFWEALRQAQGKLNG